MLTVGLLGAGRIGQVHAASIAQHPQSNLVAVADVHEPAAAALATKYATAVCTTEQILADPGISAVLVATSTDTHASLVEAAVAAGKAVLCEKPIDLSLNRARACMASVGNAPVMVGFNRRFDPSFRALRAALVAEEIGSPELLSITSFDPAPPPIGYVKVSGGLFRDMTIHDFDMANFLMGDLPTTVSAVASSLVDPEIAKVGDVDTAIVTLSYADGRLAVIRNSRRATYGYDQRIEVLGAKGALQADNVLETTVVKSTDAGIVGAKPMHFFLERYAAAFAAEWDAFVRAVSEGGPVPVGVSDGVAALAMAEAATLSVASGTPVAMADVS